VDNRGKALDEKYRDFAHHYMAIGAPTFQKIRASAVAAGFGEKWARAKSYKLLDRTRVQQFIRAIRTNRLRKEVATADEVLSRMTSILRANPKDLVGEDDRLISLAQLPDDKVQSMIAGVKQRTRVAQGKEDGTVILESTLEYKLLDKIKVLEMLAKYHGLYEDDLRPKIEQNTTNNNLVLVGYPTEPMTLAEWARQVQELRAMRAAQEQLEAAQ